MNYITIEDKIYPNLLKNIYNPPKKLYYLGNINLINKFTIAIVGSRESSYYGNTISKEFANDLSKKGVIIVSGLARGIDKYAHIGAGKNTIAVLGCGINIIYPGENRKVYENIIKAGGLIISEYDINTPPYKSNFIARNRIISGISNGVIVVEAKKKSGTFSTVDFALEQGKNVFAIPGPINSLKSEGTNELIKQGAKMVTNINDILEEYIM